LSDWTPIFSVPGVQFINLQYGDCGQELSILEQSTGVTVHRWNDIDPLRDLDGFAAQIAALDLVISVDNSTVHMAGAVGVPVWNMIPFSPDWRWQLHSDETLWYSSMRLFRQPTRGDWTSVFAAVGRRLKELTLAASGRPPL
jgi:ADP-heptose:LPS heptosyltransferase